MAFILGPLSQQVPPQGAEQTKHNPVPTMTPCLACDPGKHFSVFFMAVFWMPLPMVLVCPFVSLKMQPCSLLGPVHSSGYTSPPNHTALFFTSLPTLPLSALHYLGPEPSSSLQ